MNLKNINLTNINITQLARQYRWILFSFVLLVLGILVIIYFVSGTDAQVNEPPSQQPEAVYLKRVDSLTALRDHYLDSIEMCGSLIRRYDPSFNPRKSGTQRIKSESDTVKAVLSLRDAYRLRTWELNKGIDSEKVNYYRIIARRPITEDNE